MAHLNGVGAGLGLHYVGNTAGVAADDTRAQQEQRAGGVRIVGHAQMQIEIERFGQIVCLVKFISLEREAGKIGAQTFFESVMDIFRVGALDECALAFCVVAAEDFFHIPGERAIGGQSKTAGTAEACDRGRKHGHLEDLAVCTVRDVAPGALQGCADESDRGFLICGIEDEQRFAVCRFDAGNETRVIFIRGKLDGGDHVVANQ